MQLLKFGLVGGSGYAVNLAVFALLTGALGVHHIPAAIGAFCVAVVNNFWLEPPLDVRRRRRPRRLSGGAVLRRQPRSASGSTWRCSSSSSPASTSPSCSAQALAVALTMPVNFIGNKLWTFDDR